MNWDEIMKDLDYRHYILLILSGLLLFFILYLLFRNFTLPINEKKKPEYIYSEPIKSPTSYIPKPIKEEKYSIEPGDKIITKKKASKGEKECKRVFEEIYGIEFPTVRPKWLINPKTGKRLELDGYSFKHRIAFEYNGNQHYDPKSFGQGDEKLKEQQERDRIKLDLCDKKGIYVITIPHTTPVDQIRDYIIYYLPENRRKRLENGTTE